MPGTCGKQTDAQGARRYQLRIDDTKKNWFLKMSSAETLQWAVDTRYVQVASMSLMVFDYCGTVLVLLNNLPEKVRNIHHTSTTLSNTMHLNVVFISVVVNGFCSEHGFVSMRLWAVYKSLSLVLWMSFFIVLCWVGMIVVGITGISRAGVISQNLLPDLQILCIPASIAHYAWAFCLNERSARVPPIVIETISVILVVGKAVQHSRPSQTEFSKAQFSLTRFMECMARYSVIYLVLTLIAYIAVFYSWIRLPIAALELFFPLSLALPSVATARMLLSVRRVFSSNSEESTTGSRIVLLDHVPEIRWKWEEDRRRVREAVCKEKKKDEEEMMWEEEAAEAFRKGSFPAVLEEFWPQTQLFPLLEEQGKMQLGGRGKYGNRVQDLQGAQGAVNL
ncbi:hypothetical protein BU17DRAFT_70031 [Hysterangium stoloniferum]|nr:hypothetical protein BU17DRAFT_70031 [Hysterangium stoloniferum]